MIYGGLEYEFSQAEIYTEASISEKYHLNPDLIEKFAISKVNGYEYKYIVVKVHAKKLAEELKMPNFYNLINRYIWCGNEEQIKDLIMPQDYRNPSDLKVGEETEWYEVMNISDAHVDKDLWEKVEKQKFYIELMDCEGHEYLSWIKVLN